MRVRVEREDGWIPVRNFNATSTRIFYTPKVQRAGCGKNKNKQIHPRERKMSSAATRGKPPAVRGVKLNYGRMCDMAASSLKAILASRKHAPIEVELDAAACWEAAEAIHRAAGDRSSQDVRVQERLLLDATDLSGRDRVMVFAPAFVHRYGPVSVRTAMPLAVDRIVQYSPSRLVILCAAAQRKDVEASIPPCRSCKVEIFEVETTFGNDTLHPEMVGHFQVPPEAEARIHSRLGVSSAPSKLLPRIMNDDAAARYGGTNGTVAVKMDSPSAGHSYQIRYVGADRGSADAQEVEM